MATTTKTKTKPAVNICYQAGLCTTLGVTPMATRTYEVLKNPSWKEFMVDVLTAREISREGTYLVWYTAFQHGTGIITGFTIGPLYRVSFGSHHGFTIATGPAPLHASNRLTTWPPK